QLTDDNDRQQDRIPQLQELIQAKMDELARTIALRKGAGFEAAQAEVLTHLGKNLMDDLRALIAKMRDDERGLLRVRQEANDRAYWISLVSGVIGALMGLAAVLAIVWLLQRHTHARLKAATVLHEQREWLRTTLTSIGDAVIATDTKGRVTFLNSVAEALTGWKEDEANGQPLETVFRIVNEETHNTVENPALRALKEGRIVGLANHTVLISKVGTECPIDDSAAPIRDQKNQIAGVVLVFRDISARKREESERRIQVAQLAATEERVRSVVNNVVDGIITIDERGLVETFNPAAESLFGYMGEDIIGQNVKMLMPEPYHSGHDGFVANYLHTGDAKIIGIGREVQGRRKDGSTFPMELAVSEFRLGERRYFTGIVRDITERKRTEKQMYALLIELKEADRRKDEFLATLAHELRGPLAPLCNTLEIIKRADGGDLLQQARDTTERQLGQMVRLVDDLLDVSRITRNKLELRRQSVELASIVYQAVETCRPLAESHRHEVTVALPPESIYINGDSVRLAQVFSNLLNNACKYTEPGGRIWLNAERQGSDVLVSVKDNGIGIPPGMVPHIFEMFMQVDRTLERSGGGLGIGLTLVKQLVELHDGRVEAFSDGPGLGSEFVVRLPILVDKPERRATVPPIAGTPATARRILVVDDNVDSAESLAVLLKVTGNETHTAYDGLEAVEAAQQFRPEVVLLDIGLPRLNGYDAARRIREQPWGKNMLLVALTGWGQDEDRRKLKDAGFDHHMVKPVDYTALMTLLATLPTEQGGQLSKS
ncbi:MAG TPA: PAS domain S-box protein, partial [Gemmataceae bacterium]